jgi:hypothetical protein
MVVFIRTRGICGDYIDAFTVLQALPVRWRALHGDPADQLLVGGGISFVPRARQVLLLTATKKTGSLGGATRVGFTA